MLARGLALAIVLSAALVPGGAEAGKKEKALLAIPPYSPAYEPRTVDERGMWMEADEAERQLQRSPLVVRDEALNAYVRQVLCEAVGPDRCNSVRIYIVEMPVFNATMTPNGVMTVWTGLLLRVRSAAELGALLGHEFAHFELRHSLHGFKNKRTSTDLLAWVTVIGAIANEDVSDTQFSLLASIYRYDRSQEEEADRLGLAYLGASSLPSAAAADVWRNIMAETDATASGRMQKVKHKYTAGYFDSHPTTLKRADYLSKEAEAIGDAAEDPQALGHFAAIQGTLPRMLSDQVKLGDFGGTEYLLSELAKRGGWTPPLLYARAEMYRMRGNPRDLVSAAGFYKEAIAQGYTESEAYRNLGVVLLRSGARSEAIGHLNEYLRLRPDAPDGAVIHSLIAEQVP
jgi:predicted Zn-dependent protease